MNAAKSTPLSSDVNQDMNDQPPEWKPDVMTMSEVDAKPVEWLWEGYIPRGALTILEGDPGLGKSQIACDIAARVTRGLPMPHQLKEEES